MCKNTVKTPVLEASELEDYTWKSNPAAHLVICDVCREHLGFGHLPRERELSLPPGDGKARRCVEILDSEDATACAALLPVLLARLREEWRRDGVSLEERFPGHWQFLI